MAVYIRGFFKGYIYPYYNYYPTVSEGGAVPKVFSLGVGFSRIRDPSVGLIGVIYLGGFITMRSTGVYKV